MSLTKPTGYEWFLGAGCGVALWFVDAVLMEDLHGFGRFFVWVIVGLLIVVYPKSSAHKRREHGERLSALLRDTFKGPANK